MADDQNSLVVEVYKAYIEDVNHLRNSRDTNNNLYQTILTLFLGAQAYVASVWLTQDQLKRFPDPRLDAWVPVLVVAGIGLVGIAFCRNWNRLSADFKRSISFKFKNLEALETQWPVLKDIGARLFLEEYYDRHPEKRPVPQNTERGSRSAAISSDAVAKDAAAKRGRGVSAKAAEIQFLFRNVFVAVSLGIPLAKLVAVSAPLIQHILAHISALA